MMLDVPENWYLGSKIPNGNFETGFKVLTLHLRSLFTHCLRNCRLRVGNTLLRDFEVVPEPHRVSDCHETWFLSQKRSKEQF